MTKIGAPVSMLQFPRDGRRRRRSRRRPRSREPGREPAGAHVLGERGEPQRHVDLRTGHEGPLALYPVEPALRDEVLHGLPRGHPGQPVPGGQFALGRHRRVDGQLVLDEVEQDLAQLEVLRHGAARVDGGQGPAPRVRLRVRGLDQRSHTLTRDSVDPRAAASPSLGRRDPGRAKARSPRRTSQPRPLPDRRDRVHRCRCRRTAPRRTRRRDPARWRRPSCRRSWPGCRSPTTRCRTWRRRCRRPCRWSGSGP